MIQRILKLPMSMQATVNLWKLQNVSTASIIVRDPPLFFINSTYTCSEMRYCTYQHASQSGMHVTARKPTRTDLRDHQTRVSNRHVYLSNKPSCRKGHGYASTNTDKCVSTGTRTKKLETRVSRHTYHLIHIYVQINNNACHSDTRTHKPIETTMRVS